MTGEVAVTGGSHGLAASYAGILDLATTFDAVGDRLRAATAELLGVVTDGALAGSAVLAPGSYVAAQRALGDALLAGDGLARQALAWEAGARAARAAVAALQAADRAVVAALDAVDYAAGRIAGTVLAGPLLAGGLVVGGAVALERLGGPGLPTARWTVPHRQVTQRLVNAAGGLVDGVLTAPLGPAGLFVPPRHPGGATVAGRLADAYGAPGQPVVRPVSSTRASSAPDLPGLLRHLDRARVAEEQQGRDGTVTIDTLTDEHGRRSHVVHLPGTDDMGTLPWTRGEQARDMRGNLAMLAGEDSTFSEGVVDVLDRAGLTPEDRVMLVGHSQGGMTALHLASAEHGLDVEHVVTAGAPAARADPSAGTRVLSLEHAGDAVPLLDGADNPDTEAHVTVRFDRPANGLVAAHALPAHVAGAESAVASGHPSLLDRVTRMREDGFLADPDEVRVRRQVWQVSRAP